MQKEYVEIKIPIFDDANEIEIVKTFNEQQLYYVCALAKAFENSKNEKQQLIKFLEDKIKEYDELMRILEKNGNNNELEFYKKETFQEVLDFIKEVL